MCFLCKIEELVLMQVMLTVVPPSLLCSGYQISFLEAKWPGHGIDHPPLSSTKVEGKWSYTSTPPPGLCGLF